MNTQARLSIIIAIAAPLLLGGWTNACAQSTFQSISCGPTAISADGLVIVGGGYRWTLDAGLVALGSLPPPHDWATAACAVSADGSTIVGYGNAEAGINYRAFRWTQEQGLVGLGQANRTWGFGWGVSGDGNVVVGEAYAENGIQAFRWTPPNSMTFLGVLPGTSKSVAKGVSADGSIVVGYSQFGAGACRIFRWTSERGMTDLGNGYALAVSADGAAIVGCTGINGFSEAFRYTIESGVVGLGDLPGDTLWSEPTAISGDGSIVVGRSYTDLPGGRAFIWDAAHGMRQLHSVFMSRGLDVAGWTLSNATGISADGRTIVGTGTNPKGQGTAWLAVLGAPCPADFNTDGAATSQDFFDYITAFFAQQTAADTNADGAVTTEDFFEFLTAFFVGCP